MGRHSRSAVVVAALVAQAAWQGTAHAQATPAPPDDPSTTPADPAAGTAEGEKAKTPEPEPVAPGEEADSTKPTPPPAPPGITPLPGAPSDPSTNEADKRIGVGLDGMFLFPVGNFGDQTGPLIGPVMRFGYRFVPWLETSVIAGYLFAIAKDRGGGVRTSLDLLPIWLELRVFIVRPFTGPYAGVAAGTITYLPLVQPAIPGPEGDRVTELRRRFGGNLALGYVVSPSFPIDVRVQLVMPNLIGQDPALKEKTDIGVSMGIGYTLQF